MCHGSVQVFGKTMVCKDLDIASQVMQRANMDSVSIQGEKVSKKGTYTGGFLDTSRCHPPLQELLNLCVF